MTLAVPSASGNGHDLKTQARVICIGSLGNLVAGYHCDTDAAFARYFAQAFSPGSNPVAQPIHVASLFACGFIARLIGGWLLGYLGHRGRRRKALMLCVLLSCFGLVIIALRPT